MTAGKLDPIYPAFVRLPRNIPGEVCGGAGENVDAEKLTLVGFFIR